MAEIQQRGQTEQMRDKRETNATQLEHQYRMQQLQSSEFQGHMKTMTQEDIATKKDKTLRDIGAAKEANRLAEVNMKRAHEARKPPPKPPQPGKGPPK